MVLAPTDFGCFETSASNSAIAASGLFCATYSSPSLV